MISWNISGKNMAKNYIAQTPSTGLLNEEYIFKSNLDSQPINEQKIKVYKFLSVFPFSHSGSGKWKSKISKEDSLIFRISPGKPLVTRFNDSFINAIAIFPKGKISIAKFNLKKELFQNTPENLISSYSFDTTLYEEQVERVELDFKIDKKFLNYSNFKEVEIFLLDKDWHKANASKYKEDKNYFYYFGSFEFAEGFAIIGIKESAPKDNIPFLNYFTRLSTSKKYPNLNFPERVSIFFKKFGTQKISHKQL
jgi:hypothetical protein